VRCDFPYLTLAPNSDVHTWSVRLYTRLGSSKYIHRGSKKWYLESTLISTMHPWIYSCSCIMCDKTIVGQNCHTQTGSCGPALSVSYRYRCRPLQYRLWRFCTSDKDRAKQNGYTISLSATQASMHTYARLIYLCIYIYIIYIYIYIYISIDRYVCLRMCVCVQLYAYIYMHICIYTYIRV
jgi:hypothetical protein